MSEFMVIAPSDYTKVNIDDFCNPISWGIGDLKTLEERQNYNDVNELLHNVGSLEENKHVTGIKLIEDRELYIKYEEWL